MGCRLPLHRENSAHKNLQLYLVNNLKSGPSDPEATEATACELLLSRLPPPASAPAASLSLIDKKFAMVFCVLARAAVACDDYFIDN